MPNWDQVLKEINREKDDPGGESASDKVRKKYLFELHKHHGRNIIFYYSGFLSKPKVEGSEINDEDKNGFMLCIHGMERKRGLDLFLHTPGGSGAATESLVHYLRQMFDKDIRAFVPQIAMSAGTILACACKEIFMGKHSNLGPVDPQVNGLHAYAVVKQIDLAFADIMNDNRRYIVWNPILGTYTPGFVQQCEWIIQRGKDMVTEFLKSNMLSHLPEAEREARAERIITVLTDLSSDKGHDKHIHYEECKDMGLEVRSLEDPKDRKLQDLVLTVHHCYMLTLSNTPALKIIENHTARRYVKLLQQPGVMLQLPQTLQDELLKDVQKDKAPGGQKH
jgi:ClpP class serine protease